MNKKEIHELLLTNSDQIFDLLRDKNISNRFLILEVLTQIAETRPHLVEKITYDLSEVLRLELLPVFAEGQTAEDRAAFKVATNLVSKLALTLENPIPLRGLINYFGTQIIDRNEAVKIPSIEVFGDLLRVMPQYFDTDLLKFVMKLSNDEDSKVQAALMSAMEKIARANSEIPLKIFGIATELLNSKSENVRFNTASFIRTLSERAPDECKTVLPILRELKKKDPCSKVRDMVTAAIQVISLS